MSHYETLGVAQDASSGAIRDAYRRLARQHHPDRRAASREASAAMAALNEAYRILGDPVRRATYDAGLREARAAAAGRPPPTRPAAAAERAVTVPVATGPARYPWRLVAGMATVGIAIVLLGAVLYEPRQPAPPDNLLEAGSCVAIEGNGDAREVACTGGPDDLVVAALVSGEETCPVGTAAHRDRQGRGTACVRVTGTATTAS